MGYYSDLYVRIAEDYQRSMAMDALYAKYKPMGVSEQEILDITIECDREFQSTTDINFEIQCNQWDNAHSFQDCE